jgi:hypothetical protein
MVFAPKEGDSKGDGRRQIVEDDGGCMMPDNGIWA